MASLIRTLENTIGHRVRRALDQIAGRPTGKVNQINGRRNNTYRLNYCNDLEHNTERDDWIKAVIQFKRDHGRNPDMAEAFRLAKSLGYRREPA